ncbi:hypothetical protein DQQ10_24080 [Pseudochryseolinea flava]|uniref:Uncharacterized protein n=1 Tax=Pseudochryseolinea flava TaxID=2059302 RepID=A0A364XVS4_9BACT|nr:hypothetical protein DQQ10_24080 [Pseudochryseolinea flava]
MKKLRAESGKLKAIQCVLLAAALFFLRTSERSERKLIDDFLFILIIKKGLPSQTFLSIQFEFIVLLF